MHSEQATVIIVGAGMAGIACAARLRELGIDDFKVIDQGDAVGASWRSRYDRLTLNSPYHDLPGDDGLRARWGVFLHRDEVVEYLEAYAAKHHLSEHLQLGTRVESIEHRDRWQLTTSRGPIRARVLVVATALNRVPRELALSGAERFAGRMLHTSRYRNAREFRDQRVLILGSGNSAADIALDLVEGGAESVAMWVRAPRHVLAREQYGRNAAMARRLKIAFTPASMAKSHLVTKHVAQWEACLDAQDDLLLPCSIDLAPYGIRRPAFGPALEIHRFGREPWYDTGTADHIRAGRIEVIDGNLAALEGLTANGIQFTSGERTFDAILAATGYVPGLESFIRDSERFLAWDADRAHLMPKTDGRCRSRVEPTLFFAGFDETPNGGMSLGLWGFEIANAIHGDLAAARAPAFAMDGERVI